MTEPAKPADPVAASVAELRAIIKQFGRDDLDRRTMAAAARLKRSSTIVCVVGEFKQGKSSLVNGLLGRSVLPVDDDLATSVITLIKHAETESAIVRRREDGELKTESLSPDQIGDWGSELGNPGNRRGAERLEVSLPAKVLAQGLVLVDTPGMGGLGAGHAAATQAFLPFADGLVLVSDASAELSAPEIEFMRQATALCPTVMFVQSKIDLYPSWQRIFDLNKAHLDRAGLSIPMLATSAALRMSALARSDRDLNDRSGYPALIDTLINRIVAPAKAAARQRSVDDVTSVVSLLRATAQEEQAALTNPEQREQALVRLQGATAALENVRGPGAKWQVALNDGIGDLSNRVNFGMRGDFRQVTEEFDERIEQMKTSQDWDVASRDLQSAVATVVATAFNAVVDGAAELRENLIAIVNDEHLSIGPGISAGGTFDVTQYWKEKSLDTEDEGAVKRGFKKGLTGVRGAQSGVMMFGMLGGFLPAAVGTLMASNPILLTAGAAFGGFQLMEERKRRLAQRRAQAKNQTRKFIDNTQFDVGNEIASLVKEFQRDLRDEFSSGLAELQRSYTESINQIKQSQQATDAENRQRLEQLNIVSKALGGVEQRLKAAQ
ncbi:MAG TPA: dynamin family protein [Aeromicrobium sp.]|nr:dynamin family protein [Aeromicrobium sp.]